MNKSIVHNKKLNRISCKHLPDIGMLRLADSRASFETLYWLGFPWKLIYAKYSKLYDRGFLETGSFWWRSWLTPKGEQYLEELEKNHGE